MQAKTSTRYFDLEVFAEERVVRITESFLCGDAIAEILRIELFRVASEWGNHAFVLDMSVVTSLSSSVIGTLIKLQKLLSQRGIRVRLQSVSDHLFDVFRTLNLVGTHFDVEPRDRSAQA